MPSNRMHEDFFQRIKDVKWESEPEVYWMAGSGSGIAREGVGGRDNGAPFGDVWTSEDGLHWNGGDTGEIEFGGAIGIWMRSGFQKEGKPVWLMPGQTKKARSALYISTDGQSAYVKGFDRGHHIDNLQRQGSSLDMLQHNFYAVDKGGGADHMEHFKSSDGINWTPERYHAEESPDTGGSFMAAEMAVYGPATPRTVHESNPDVLTVAPPSSLILRKALVPYRAAVPDISTMATQQTAPEDQNQIYQRCTGSAFGKVRKGKLAGQKIKITQVGGEGGHGGYYTGEVQVQAADGSVFNASTRLSKSWCIGYGHYVFAVGGTTGAGCAIAYTEDGVEWQMTAQGKPGGFWTMAVGARK